MWWLFLLACTTPVEDERLSVTVVRGDTLFEIAEAHGVTLEALRAANGIEGDLIEVGQVLRIPSGGTVPAPASPRPRPKAVRPATSGHGLQRPSPQPCVPPPSGTDLADEGMVASVGLSAAQVRGVMGQHLQHTLACAQGEPAWPTGAVQAELTVACDGTVSAVRVLSSEGLAPDTVDCVRDVLGYAGFPAHDLPEGYTFTQPVRFSP